LTVEIKKIILNYGNEIYLDAVKAFSTTSLPIAKAFAIAKVEIGCPTIDIIRK
jgi:hypothetical protein